MTPFKFNPAWLLEEDYQKMIGHSWNHFGANPNVSYMKKLAENLNKVKKVSKPWAKVYYANQQKQLKEVESSLKRIYEQNNSDIFSEEELKEVKEKELKREELLAKDEQLLRLKIRAIWIKEGDNNTKLFHNFANKRRN